MEMKKQSLKLEIKGLKKLEEKETKITISTNLSQFAEITFPGEPRQNTLPPFL